MGFISSNDVKYINGGAREENSSRNSTTKVLASTDNSIYRQGAGVGTVENGAPSEKFSYTDEAGRLYETCSNHTHQQRAEAATSNVPAEEYSVAVPNVANRFAR